MQNKQASPLLMSSIVKPHAALSMGKEDDNGRGSSGEPSTAVVRYRHGTVQGCLKPLTFPEGETTEVILGLGLGVNDHLQ